MKLLLGRYMDLLSLTIADRNLSTFIPSDLFTVRPGLGAAVGGLVDLAGEGVGHLRALGWLWLMVPQLLFVSTGHLWNYELDLLLYQFTLLPGHWFTLFCTSPNLQVKEIVSCIGIS